MAEAQDMAKFMDCVMCEFFVRVVVHTGCRVWLTGGPAAGVVIKIRGRIALSLILI
jgi:hypothetical protein